MTLPLTGIRVVALEQAASAPFCTRQLADMGADVIKIERPGEGDLARGYDGALNGLSAYFAFLNRGKRSIVLDVKEPTGHAALAKLIARADVFVHNLAPGAVERLGFDYEQLRETHPRLIWCGISGYGPDGPCRDKKAYDMLVQAESGVVGITGSKDEPAKVGVSMADFASGLYGYSSILAALLRRGQTGEGERIDISMFECLVEWMMPQLYVYMGTGKVVPRAGIRHSMIVPYGAYSCADGFVMFAIQNEREWKRLCEQVLEMPELATDPRYTGNAQRLAHRIELEALIEKRLSEWPRAQVAAKLDAAEMPNGELNDVPSVVNHRALEGRERWREVESEAGTIRALLPPHNLAHVPAAMGRIPGLGEHTEEILKELGIENG